MADAGRHYSRQCDEALGVLERFIPPSQTNPMFRTIYFFGRTAGDNTMRVDGEQFIAAWSPLLEAHK